MSVEVAGRLVQLERQGALRRCDPVGATAAASAASSCALLAMGLQLDRSQAARVGAAGAVPLGSGRVVLQGMLLLSDTQLQQPDMVGLAADQLDCLQFMMHLAGHRGIQREFAARVAPPEQLLGWLRDAAALLARLWPLPRSGRRGREMGRVCSAA